MTPKHYTFTAVYRGEAVPPLLRGPLKTAKAPFKSNAPTDLLEGEVRDFLIANGIPAKAIVSISIVEVQQASKTQAPVIEHQKETRH